MSPVKEKILGVVELMDEKQAEQFWKMICGSFFVTEKSWDNMEETDPDEFDMKMLEEIESEPDCHEFISSEEAYKELGLN